MEQDPHYHERNGIAVICFVFIVVGMYLNDGKYIAAAIFCLFLMVFLGPEFHNKKKNGRQNP